MVQYQTSMPRRVYYQMTTTNQSFLDVHYFLKETGIKNNKFMLVLLDPDLAGIDPHDKRLSPVMQQKVLRECLNNYWYFLREVVRIPDAGGLGGGAKYKLSRGNLALNFCMTLNLNIFLELPRQQGKTMSALCRYLYLFNFGTTHSEIAFLNKRLEDSKLNLQRLKELREALPTYLRMDHFTTPDGKIIKATNTVQSLSHLTNGNRIKAIASANSKVAAASLLRGKTIPLLYWDEFAFMPHNEVAYLNGVPAYKTAADISKANGAPYGMLITTTPGFLTTEEGRVAYEFKTAATPFSELWYNMDYNSLMTLINANVSSSFVYIRYTYQELGKSEEWFMEQCRDMKMKWPDIRREIMLEWSAAPENCPFTREQLDGIRELVKSPINQILFLGKYVVNIYEMIDLRYPPIIGVDVSGGYKRDSSSIVGIDSRTTKLFFDFNCNYIPPTDLSRLIYELVTTRMPNAVVNVERNGGFGASVLAALIASKVKHNLYYEIKDRVIEEHVFGNNIHKMTQKTKVYGTDNTKNTRDALIQILRERVEYHKDKFVSPNIFEELCGMEVKKNGKIEHSVNTHDDSVFALLMALYVWYEGKDIAERYGIQKQAIKTDAALEEAIFGLEEKYSDILKDIDEPVEDNLGIRQQLAEAQKAIGKTYQEWANEEARKDDEAMRALMQSRIGAQAYSQKFGTPLEDLQKGLFTVPTNVFEDFYSNGNTSMDDSDAKVADRNNGNFMW